LKKELSISEWAAQAGKAKLFYENLRRLKARFLSGLAEEYYFDGYSFWQAVNKVRAIQ